jgi:hypothetical protein
MSCLFRFNEWFYVFLEHDVRNCAEKSHVYTYQAEGNQALATVRMKYCGQVHAADVGLPSPPTV